MWKTAATTAALVALAGCGQTQQASPPRSLPAATPSAQEADQSVQTVMAAWARRGGNTEVPDYQQPKHSWVSGLGTGGGALDWPMNLTSDEEFLVEVLVKTPAGPQALELHVDGTRAAEFRTTSDDWERVRAGVIHLPAGPSMLRLAAKSEKPGIDVKSLELIRTADLESHQARTAQFKAAAASARDRLSLNGYGVMFQYGPWSYPLHGPKKPIEDHARDFDVPAFVRLVKDVGARHVIWSATWWEYAWYAPIHSVDAVVGHSERTASRDVIGEIATALEREGIDFFLYYHSGHDGHFGYNTTDWWKAQVWPDEFRFTATGDRKTFFRNWAAVISEVGARYGTRLDGWFFDDAGFVYYPADFAHLGEVARRGNPQRIVSWNSWELPRITDFQDVNFGEDGGAQGRRCLGQVEEGSAPPGSNGVFTSGPYRGLLQHCMIRMEHDWGVHDPDTPLPKPDMTADELIKLVQDAQRRRVPLTFNLMMYEGGVVSPASLAVLKELRAAVR